MRREPSRIVSDLGSTPLRSRRSFLITIGLAVVALIGFVALAVKWGVDGGDSTRWGYVATLCAFLLSLSFGGPAAYIISSVAKAVWGRTIARVSTLFALVGVLTAAAMIPLAFQVPPLIVDEIRRRSIWYEAPIHSPTGWMIAGIVGLMVAGLALLYLSLLPDLAHMRDHEKGWRQRWGRRLARGWVGNSRQWRSWRVLNGALSATYLLFGVLIILLFTADFNMGLVPGWRDSIFPATFAQTAVQGGLAALIIALFILRRTQPVLKEYFTVDHFWTLSRLLFAATLLWVYFFYSGFIVFWYGRSGSDQAVLNLLIIGPLQWAMFLSAIFSFVVPFFVLVWNVVRKSVKGPVIASVSILFGLFFERLRVNLAAWSVPNSQINERFLLHNPPIALPSVLDILILVGGLVGVVFVLMLGLRMVPAVSVWKTLQLNLITRPYKYLRTRGMLVAKSD